MCRRPPNRGTWSKSWDEVRRAVGLLGVARGRRARRTVSARAEAVAEAPRDLVQRQFTAMRPNQLRVADFTYAVAGTPLLHPNNRAC